MLHSESIPRTSKIILKQWSSYLFTTGNALISKKSDVHKAGEIFASSCHEHMMIKKNVPPDLEKGWTNAPCCVKPAYFAILNLLW